MTAVSTRTEPDSAAPADAPAAAPKPAAAPVKAPRRRGVGRGIALGVALFLVVLLGFAVYVYGLSGLSEKRQQHNARLTFSGRLAEATADVTAIKEGTPIAALSIPKLGLTNVIVGEGTTSRDLTNGPGHLVSTPLPGQAGTSVIFGRRVMFGAPFQHLMRLDVGDTLTVATGQAISTFRVSSFGNEKHPAPANSANRLLLVTASSGGAPTSYVTVSADLTSKVQPSGSVGAATPAMLPMADGFTGSLLPMLLWSQALLALAVLVTVGFYRWNRAALYLVAAPAALCVLWNLYENGAAMLPNLF